MKYYAVLIQDQATGALTVVTLQAESVQMVRTLVGASKRSDIVMIVESVRGQAGVNMYREGLITSCASAIN